jgi:hypothetical protein
MVADVSSNRSGWLNASRSCGSKYRDRGFVHHFCNQVVSQLQRGKTMVDLDKAIDRLKFEYPRCFESEVRRSMNEAYDIERIAGHDPFVSHYLRCWKEGLFRSYESMLSHLVIALAKQNAELLAMATRAKMLEMPKSVTISDGSKKGFNPFTKQDSKEGRAD